MSSNEGIKQIGPRLFEVRVQFRDPRTGRRSNRQTRVEGTWRDARRARDDLRQAVKTARTHRKRPTLSAYASSWLAARAPGLKPSVARKYMTSLDLHILPALGTMKVDSLTPADVRKYVNERIRSGAAGNTVLNELRLMRTIAGDSVADGVTIRLWTFRVEPPKPRKWTEDDPNLLTAPQLRAMLEHVPDKWRPLVLLLGFTGLRWGEASALRYGDIDRTAGLLRVRRGNWKGRVVTPKTDSSTRSVPLPPIDIGTGEDDMYVFCAKRGKQKGQLYKGSPLRAVLERACKAAKVPRITTHGLRRTFNDLARQVADSQVVKSITGHTTDTMLEHYSMVSHGERQAAQRKVLELVSSADGASRSASDAGANR